MNEKQEIEIQKQYIEKVSNLIQNKNLKYTILTMGCQLFGKVGELKNLKEKITL